MADLLRAAAGYVDLLGLSLIVADENKEPLPGFGPKSATKSLRKIERALCRGATLAARVGRALVLDVDTRHDGHAALAKLLAHFGPLPATWEVETPTGGKHYWFDGVPFEIKGSLAKGCETLRGNRLITLPPSERAGGAYRWIQHPLKVRRAAAPQWMLDDIRLAPVPVREHGSAEDPAVRERRARAWIAKADPAIQHQRGSDRTIAVAVRIVRGFDLDKDTALSVMRDWNSTCCPPWSDYDLKRKIHDAYRKGRMEWGAMLKARAA
jgi:hypothetical protein